ncbi:MAG: hypothetical protein JXD23_04150 [Spirochaetales bacterium]|nr:hypothetical protein [Spirochaetales bacterium]
MRRIEEELGFLSLASGGRLVETVKAAGFMGVGRVRKDIRLVETALRAGEALAMSFSPV